MNPVKVKQTEKHREHIVCKGKLVLIPKTVIDCSGDMQYTWKQGVLFNKQPIIISETEEIESGDIIAHHEYGIGKVISPKATGKYWICQFNGKEETDTVIGVFKILALSESFSPIQLESIVDGILKDGDEVFIECEWLGDKVGISYSDELYYYVKLTNNFINIIKPRKQGLDLDKISKLIDEALDNETTESITKWLLDKRKKEGTKGYHDVNEFYQEKESTWNDIFREFDKDDEKEGMLDLKEWLQENYNIPLKK